MIAPPGFRGTFATDLDTRRRHGGAAGPFRIAPAAVATPVDAEDVRSLIVWAANENSFLVPRGAATGMPAGNVGSGVAVNLVPAFAEIGAPDLERRVLRCGAGANAAAVARAAAQAGLAFPPLPSSAERCSIGGMVANNAAGARSFRHGATRAWIEELDVVWADGSAARLTHADAPAALRTLAAELSTSLGAPARGWPGVRKNSSGYALDHFLPAGDPVQLMVGSEGTLGLILGVTVRLVPHPPARAVLLVALPSLDLIPDAADTALRVDASACELFGRRLLELAMRGGHSLPDHGDAAEALVLIEVEGQPAEVDAALDQLRAWARSTGLTALEAIDEEERARLWGVRHAASPLIAAAAEDGRRSTQFIEDSVVPVASVPAYLRGLDRILRGAATEAVIFGHAGDGNVHVNPLVDLGTRGWRDRVRTILEETVDLVAELGGTLSGEHGDGRLRAPFLDRIWSPALAAAFRTVKRRLDPRGILNPGVIVPLAGQDPLEGLWTEMEAIG